MLYNNHWPIMIQCLAIGSRHFAVNLVVQCSIPFTYTITIFNFNSNSLIDWKRYYKRIITRQRMTMSKTCTLPTYHQIKTVCRKQKFLLKKVSIELQQNTLRQFSDYLAIKVLGIVPLFNSSGLLAFAIRPKEYPEKNWNKMFHSHCSSNGK